MSNRLTYPILSSCTINRLTIKTPIKINLKSSLTENYLKDELNLSTPV